MSSRKGFNCMTYPNAIYSTSNRRDWPHSGRATATSHPERSTSASEALYHCCHPEQGLVFARLAQRPTAVEGSLPSSMLVWGRTPSSVQVLTLLYLRPAPRAF